MKVKQTQPTIACRGMVRRLKSIQNETFFYYFLTQVIDMTLFKNVKGWGTTFHALTVSLLMTRILG